MRTAERSGQLAGYTYLIPLCWVAVGDVLPAAGPRVTAPETPLFKDCYLRTGISVQCSVSDPDPHKERPPGSGSAWTDADSDLGAKKA